MTTPADTPLDTDTLMQRLHAVDALIVAGDVRAAVDALDALARQAPGDPLVLMMRARLAEATRNAEGAVDYLRRAVAAAPEWEVPVTELALVLARYGQLGEAVAAAEHAVSLAPDSLDVLYRVVDIAQQALNPTLAIAWLERAAVLDPDNVVAQQLMARNLHQAGESARAVAAYTPLVDADPSDADSRFGRAKAALADGNRALALADCEVLLALDPANETYAFWQRVARGETPPRYPDAMTVALFDGYAAAFDEHLEGGLQYRVPAKVAQRIAQWHPDRVLNLLDLGCGTGLLMKALGTIDGEAVGVDLAPRMIEQAGKLELYKWLLTAGLQPALADSLGDHFDVVAACDVFIYAGDIAPVLADALRALKPGGRFVFSCESAAENEADLVLRPSTRYAHKASAVRALLEAAGFGEVAFDDTTIRVESGTAIPGYIAVARKPA